MTIIGRIGLAVGLAAIVTLLAPAPASAYVGPGAGLAIIGAAIAVIGVVLATVGGFIWYPVKRLWKAMGGGSGEAPPEEG